MQSPWAVILCKFNNGNEEPFPKQHYKDLVYREQHRFTVEHDPVFQ